MKSNIAQVELPKETKKRCPICSLPVSMEDFIDEFSIREFEKSGMCQICQDEFFSDEQ